MLHEILIRESALNKFSQKSYSRLTLSCALLFYFPLRPSLFVLLLTEPHSYNHKVHPHLPKLSALLSGLAGKIPPPKIVIISPLNQGQDGRSWDSEWLGWEDLVKVGQHHKLGRTQGGEIEWNQMSFDAPLWILFSSGTTGRPKCVIK